jgi:hypothetical protein
MARIYSVRERSKDHRFDMTVSSDDEGWCHAIGYCAGWTEMKTAEDVLNLHPWADKYMVAGLLKEHAKHEPFRAKYHDGGHTTREEAEACYREYEFDQELRFGERRGEQRKCAICDQWTQGFAELGQFRHFTLCPEHANRQGVEQAIALDTTR